MLRGAPFPAILLALLPFVTAQLTLYDVSVSPAEASGEAAALANAILRGAGQVQATPTSVDASGATHYVVVQELSAIPAFNPTGGFTVSPLATPTAITYKFRADASRAVYEYADATTTLGVSASVGLTVDCTHDIDSDTSVEDGTIVCAAEVGFEGGAGDVAIGTTVVVTTTGKPVAFATVTQVLQGENTGRPGGSSNSSDPSSSDGAETDGGDDATDDGAGSKAAKVGLASIGLITAGTFMLL